MRQFLNSKLSIVVLAISAVTLVAGVTWAATSPSSSSAPSAQLTSSVVEIHPLPLKVETEAKLQVAGAGFTPGEAVLFQIVLGGESPNIILAGGFANDSGAFLADTTRNFRGGGLPKALGVGVYTIVARTQAGHVASAPLVVLAPKTD